MARIRELQQPPLGMRFTWRLPGCESDWIVTSGIFSDVFGGYWVDARQTAKRGLAGRLRLHSIWPIELLPVLK